MPGCHHQTQFTDPQGAQGSLVGCPGTAFTGSLGGPGPLRASRLAPRHPRLMHTISQAEGRGNRLPVPAPEQRSVADTPGPAVPGPRGSTSPHPRHLPRLLRPRATLLLPAANPPPLLSTPPGEVAGQLLQFQTQPRLGTLARRERAHLTCTYSPGSTGLKLPGRPSAELALAQPVPAAAPTACSEPWRRRKGAQAPARRLVRHRRPARKCPTCACPAGEPLASAVHVRRLAGSAASARGRTSSLARGILGIAVCVRWVPAPSTRGILGVVVCSRRSAVALRVVQW